MVQGQFLRPVELAGQMHLVHDHVVLDLDRDGLLLVGRVVFRIEPGGQQFFAGLAVLKADAAGVDQVVPLVVIFHVADVGRVEVAAPFLAVLPDLLDGHLVRVDAIAHPA